jgi:hypothetical protein
MNSISASLEHWSAWAPGVDSAGRWQQWANGELNFSDEVKPDVSFLPAMFRRRLSSLSKMALLAAHQCRGDGGAIRTVFCSRHGELSRTVGLLQDIATSELISPTGFSMAVHNTASGLYSIANKDTSITTAIAGGIDSFQSAFIDCAAALTTGECDKVMLVIADQPLPSPLKPFADEQGLHFAAAFLLSRAAKGTTIKLKITEPGAVTKSPQLPHALAFLRFLHNDKQQLHLNGDRLGWCWSKNVD